MYKTFYEVLNTEITKFNPYHDKRGRFCGPDGASFMTIRTRDPQKQHMADRAIERARQENNEKKPKEIKLSDIKNGDWDAMERYISKNIGMTVEQDVKDQIDFESVRETVKGIEWVQGEFPQAKETFKKLDVNRRGIMSASSGGSIAYNPRYCSDISVFEETMEGNARTHFHPKNSSVAACGAHEAGHFLQYTIEERKYPLGQALPYYDMVSNLRAREKDKEAVRIVSIATKAAKKTQAGKGKKQAELQAEISEYARRDKSETIAEAMSDIYDNGDAASTLSKEIFKVLKAELG